MKWLTFLFLLITTTVLAQEKTDYNRIIDTLVDKTIDYYIFPEKAEFIKTKLSNVSKNNPFINLSKSQFADTITTILRKESKDKHFTLLYRPNFLRNTETKKDQQKKFNEINRRWNFGFDLVERLSGNIGYINYSGFAESNSSKATLAAAMNFLANTNSLILDLRNNRGGDGPMMLLFCSYFFEHQLALSKTYYRHNNKTVTNKTRSKVTGEKYLDKPIYVLTSKNTFSAAEALSYNLQQKGIATIIGEKTAGAANPVEMWVINNDFLFFIPVGNETNLISNTNWEHTGVQPSYNISHDKALEKAQIVALEYILKQQIITELSKEEIEKRIIDLSEKIE
ncbi:S41 family peptidase [Rapidithrix thailandica]|uniref:S41 family peptidase n=1 Tax=Rapidithrix thailandica TaxID=413964 RepID=A0AAW9S5N3_9BACT